MREIGVVVEKIVNVRMGPMVCDRGIWNTEIKNDLRRSTVKGSLQRLSMSKANILNRLRNIISLNLLKACTQTTGADPAMNLIGAKTEIGHRALAAEGLGVVKSPRSQGFLIL